MRRLKLQKATSMFLKPFTFALLQYRSPKIYNKMKMFITISFLLTLLSSCSLTSVTMIKPNESFELGNNVHGKFSVKIKNLSDKELRLWEIPVQGGKHSPLDVPPNKTVKVKVDKNTALRIENHHSVSASVSLRVRGDIGLSMGYKNN